MPYVTADTCVDAIRANDHVLPVFHQQHLKESQHKRDEQSIGREVVDPMFQTRYWVEVKSYEFPVIGKFITRILFTKKICLNIIVTGCWFEVIHMIFAVDICSCRQCGWHSFCCSLKLHNIGSPQCWPTKKPEEVNEDLEAMFTTDHFGTHSLGNRTPAVCDSANTFHTIIIPLLLLLFPQTLPTISPLHRRDTCSLYLILPLAIDINKVHNLVGLGTLIPMSKCTHSYRHFC